MKLTDLTSTIGAIGVIGSLSYIGFQIHQNTNALYARSHLDLLLASFSLRDSIVENKSVAELKLKADKNYTSLTIIEKLRYQAYISRPFDIWEHAYLSNDAGLIDNNVWEAWNNAYLSMLQKSGPSEYWNEYHAEYSHKFQNHINYIINNNNSQIKKTTE